ncbi:hypothetical protein GCM10023165_40800 [Variovorax defluvii]|uniref:Uncharacterized protein n=1 Tax=Variovorax defluvii TaxID=913761 RepID=A0ABP8I5U5_9BURK
MTTSQRFSYINGSDVELRVIVEPWADQFLIRPGQRVEVLVRGDGTAGAVELEQLPTGLIIYGYEGCIVSLLSDGKELAPSAQR